MTLARLATVLLALGLAAPARAEPPPALIEATESASAACTAAGGAPRILPNYETARDLNGDGQDDYVADLGQLECAGAWGALCDPAGCPVAAWLSNEQAFDRFDFGPLRGFLIEDGGAIPEIVARYDASLCGFDTAAGADCTRVWRFTDNAPEAPEPTFAQVAAAPEDANAAPEPPPAMTGWSLRRVPGGSPVALSMGTGEIASLAAFCLAGQPFLAVTLHTPTDNRTVTLGFDFSQGAVTTEAGFEETAGGAYVVPLAEGPLAARLGGRDSEVPVSLDGTRQGILSLSGSTRALSGALEGCR